MQYYRLETFINLFDGYRKALRINEHHLLLLQHDGELYLLEATCPHRAYPLLEATLEDGKLRCPQHDYAFSLANGELLHCTEQPCRALRRYDLVVLEREVGVML